jgi:hypothetical protein
LLISIADRFALGRPDGLLHFLSKSIDVHKS